MEEQRKVWFWEPLECRKAAIPVEFSRGDERSWKGSLQEVWESESENL